ncbi:hypothetical protein PINS_up002432 [Pythium insidiosum]|nr:hypothetical protein PINS_up002432 [Pythium insidiosum]
MVQHTVTRMEGADGAVLVVPEALKEALTMVESASPAETIEGLAKLSHVVFNNQLCKEAAGDLGAIKVVASAMARNLDNAALQVDGCHALRNIVFHCEQNVQLVREEGGIEAVLNAMKKHAEAEAVQAEGCWALVVFCSNHDENVAAVKPFAEIVDSAVQTHEKNANIASKGRFLQALLA